MITLILSVSSSVRRQVSKSLKEIFNLAAEQFDMNPSTCSTLEILMTMMSWVPSMVAGTQYWFNHRGRSLKPGTKPVFDLKSIVLSNSLER